MPNIDSAAKRLRQNVKRQRFNRMRKSRVKTAEVNLTYILANKANVLLMRAFTSVALAPGAWNTMKRAPGLS